jgi:hypothetical protein
VVTRYQKTVFTSLLVFVPAGVAVAIWFQLTHAASSSMLVVAGVIVIVVVAFAINQAVLIVPLRRRLANAVERQDADALDAILDETMAMWPRSVKMRAFVDGNRAVALMFREWWDEAVVQARGTLARPNAPAQEALLLTNRAARVLPTAHASHAMLTPDAIICPSTSFISIAAIPVPRTDAAT